MRLIDADVLKEKLDEIERYIDCDESCTTWILSDEVYNAVDNAPSIIKCGKTSDGLPLMDLRPRSQGEWKIGGKTTHYHYCSICGKDGDLQDNFCRNCGAMMKGGSE